MQDLITAQPVSMTSLQIADLTSKKHSNVLRDMRDDFTELFLASDQAAEISQYSAQRTKAVQLNVHTLPPGVTVRYNANNSMDYFTLSGKYIIFAAARYSPVLRLKIIDRVLHLEKQNKQHLLEAYTKAERARLTEKDKRLTAEEETSHLLMKLNAVGRKQCRICGEVVHNKDFYHDSRYMCKRCARYQK